MASYIGQVPEFVPTKQKWVVYIEQVNTFFGANDIEDDKKKGAFSLTSMGNTAYTTLRNLTAPKTPIETDWKELLKLMEEHYSPRANPIVERCKFYQRFRQTGESLSIFLAELRALADKCEFGYQLTTSLRAYSKS